jgi:hypothetical protein
MITRKSGAWSFSKIPAVKFLIGIVSMSTYRRTTPADFFDPFSVLDPGHILFGEKRLKKA